MKGLKKRRSLSGMGESVSGVQAASRRNPSYGLRGCSFLGRSTTPDRQGSVEAHILVFELSDTRGYGPNLHRPIHKARLSYSRECDHRGHVVEIRRR